MLNGLFNALLVFLNQVLQLTSWSFKPRRRVIIWKIQKEKSFSVVQNKSLIIDGFVNTKKLYLLDSLIL